MQSRALAVFSFLVLVALAAGGCSVIGLGIGAISDSAKPDSLTVPGWEVRTVKPGREMKLTLRDGEQLTGRFAGVDSVPEKQYVQRYTSCRERTGKEAPLPAMGERIDITLNSGVEGERELLGFDYQYTTAKTKGKEVPSPVTSHCALSVRQPGDTTSGNVLVSDIERIVNKEGEVIEGPTLERLVSGGQVPFLSAIAVHDLSGRRQIGMEQVQRIELKNKKRDRWKFAFVGAAFDAALLIAAISFELGL